MSFDVSREQLTNVVEAIGPVVDVFLPLDRATGRPRGFAFVEFQNAQDVARAIDELDGKELEGRSLRVDEAREKAPRPPGGGGGGGGAPSFDNRKPFKSKGSRRGIRNRKRF